MTSMTVNEVCAWLERLAPGSDAYTFQLADPDGICKVAVPAGGHDKTLSCLVTLHINEEAAAFIDAKLYRGVSVWSDIDVKRLRAEAPLLSRGDVEALIRLLEESESLEVV